MAKSKPGPLKIITVTIDTVTHSGTYFVPGSMVHVHSTKGAKAARVGRSAPEAVAKKLLKDQFRNGGAEAEGKEMSIEYLKVLMATAEEMLTGQRPSGKREPG